MADVYTTGREAIKFLYEETQHIYRGPDGQPSLPSAGSQAESELVSVDGRDIVETAFSQGAMLIEVAADQTVACYKTLSNPAQTVAPWTCARAVMESSALGCWLMDPAIDRRVRMQRSYAFRHEGLIQQRRYAMATKHEATAEAVTQRIVEVEASALALGFPPVRDKRGRCAGIGQAMPTITEIVAQTLGACRTSGLREEFSKRT